MKLALLHKSAVCALLTLGLTAPLLTIGSAAVAASGSAADFLDGIAQGQWQLKPVGRRADAGSALSVCIKPHNLKSAAILRRPSSAGCETYTVRDTSEALTVSYTCSNGDQGMTQYRRETPRLMQVNAQGITGGMPFHDNFEARQTGGC